MREVIDRALNIDDLPSIARADIVGFAGEALRDSRPHHDAMKMLDDATRLSAPISPFLQALYIGDQVLIALDAREPSQAASLMGGLSYIVPYADSTRIDGQVRHILQISRPWAGVPEMRGARERLRSVLTDHNS